MSAFQLQKYRRLFIWPQHCKTAISKVILECSFNETALEKNHSLAVQLLVKPFSDNYLDKRLIQWCPESQPWDSIPSPLPIMDTTCNMDKNDRFICINRFWWKIMSLRYSGSQPFWCSDPLKLVHLLLLLQVTQYISVDTFTLNVIFVRDK